VVITWDSGRDPTAGVGQHANRDEEVVQQVFVFSPSTGGNDTMNGGSGQDLVFGQSGNDSLFGGNGNFTDSLVGGSGNDVLFGDSAADSLFGGLGGGSAGDFVNYSASNAAVTVNLDNNATETGGIAAGDFITGVEHIVGSNFNDNLTGIGTVQSGQETFAANNSIIGGLGNDDISGLAGNDTLFGDFSPAFDAGGGDDQIDGGVGDDVIFGGTGNDVLAGSVGGDSLFGNDGNDVLTGGAGADAMNGNTGIDQANYANSASAVDVRLNDVAAESGGDAQGDSLGGIENLLGSAFSDTLIGNEVANVISGGANNDLLIGNSGSDTLAGEAGDDTLVDGGGTFADVYHGGGQSGADTISYLNSTSRVVVNLTTGLGNGGSGADSNGDTYTNIEDVVGANFAGAGDTLTGSNGANRIFGVAGDDTINGGAGGGGVDSLFGGVGNDLLLDGGNAGADSYVGDAGSDAVSYAIATGTIVANLSTGSGNGDIAANDFFTSVETLFGGLNVDTLIGNGDANLLAGNAGDDTLRGSGGSDVLDGGANGASKANGDYADYSTSSSAVDVDLARSSGGPQFGGDAAGDTLFAIEHLIGSNTGGDVLAGDGGGNTMIGLSGSDTLIGRAGDDRLYGDATDGTGSGGDSAFGGTGVDTFFGHEGNDTVEGGSGADSLFGGTGSDWASWQNSSAAVTVDLSDAATESGGDALGDSLAGIEHLIGSSLTDILTGSANDNSIRGSDGDDTIIGGSGGGADAIFGEVGNDLLIDVGGTGGDAYDGGKASDAISYAGETVGVVVNLLSGVGSVGAATGDSYINIENIIGSGGSDTLIGNATNNTIVAGSGDDTVQGGSGADSLDGGAGTLDWVDYIGSEAGVQVTLGLAGAQASTGHAAGDVLTAFENLRGSTQDDTLASALSSIGTGTNIIDGDQGDDSLIANSGIETFIGGGGSDVVDYRGSDDLVIVNLLSGQGQSGFAEDDFYTTLNGNGSGLENVLGSAFNDTIIGVAGFNTFIGFTGNDVMFGASSRDFLRGDDGDDTLNGGSGGDSIVGGTGTSDFADYTGTNIQGVNVDLSTGRGSGGDAQGGDGFFDTLFGIEHLIGSGNSDSLTGDSGVNWLFGASGNDVLVGGGVTGDTSFHDTMYGGDGNDAMGGRAVGSLDSGVDSLFGGTGNDSVFYDLNDAAISGGLGNDTLIGNSIADQIQLDAARFNFAGGFADIEFFDLGDGNDIFLNTSSVSDLVNVGAGLNVFGGSGRDQISMRGVAGSFSGMDDNVDGGAGNDIIWGGFGNDALSGGAGDDQIYGGKGDEKLFGDQGFDVFYVGHDESSVSGTDIIFDDVNEVNGLVLFWGWDSTFGGNYDGLDPSEVTLDYSDPGKVVITMQNGGRVEFERVDNGDGTWSSSIDVLNLWDYGQGEAGNSPTPPTTFGRDVWSATFDASTGQFAAFTLAVNG
jgi:Ca2+-binding RTX toxin-like protein